MQTGRYDYWREGVAVAQETWRAEPLPCGGTRTTCRRDAGAFGIVLQVSVDATAHEQACVFTLVRDGQTTHGRYRRMQSGILWQRGQDTAWHLVAAPASAHLFPLMRVFTGAMVLALRELGGTAAVVTPSIATLDDAASVFCPLVSTRTLGLCADGSGQWLLSGGPYEHFARLSLDAEGRLTAYDWTGPDGAAWHCAAAHVAA